MLASDVVFADDADVGGGDVSGLRWAFCECSRYQLRAMSIEKEYRAASESAEMLDEIERRSDERRFAYDTVTFDGQPK